MGIPFYRPAPRPPGAFQNQVLPDTNANWISRILFSWITPLLKVGYSRPLQLDDLWTLDEPRHCKTVADHLEASLSSRRLLSQQPGQTEITDSVRTSPKITNSGSSDADRFGSDSDCSCELCLAAERSGDVSRTNSPSDYSVSPTTHITEISKSEVQHPGRTLLGALYVTFRKSLWTAGGCQAIAMALEIASPLVTQQLLIQVTTAHQYHQAIDKEDSQAPPPLGATVATAVALFVMLQTGSLFSQNFHQKSLITGVLMRSAVIDLVSRKSMRLSNRSLLVFDHGRLTTMFSADASYLEWAVGSLINVILQPLQILVGVGLLVHLLGYSALVGLGVLVASTPIQAYLFRILIDARQAQLNLIDKRVSLTSELLRNIRAVKIYAWETFFRKRILDLRRQELRHLQRGGWNRATLTSAMTFLPTMAATLTFVTYYLTGHKLDASKIFAALQLFNVLQTPLSMLPLAFQALIDAYVAMGRIGALLTSEESPLTYITDPTASKAISARGDFSFDKLAEPCVQGTVTSVRSPFRLENIDLQIDEGELVCIVGSVGSGKSALLRGLLNEMSHGATSVVFNGGLAYVPQTAWIMSGSIRSNIVFGASTDEKRLQEVVASCGLARDLRMMPDGIDTEVGENGSTLSGGQRQRIQLARAAYCQSEIVFLDDPLSAIDAQVGSHILHRAILSGPLAHRTRLLVTHEMSILPFADRVVVMESSGLIGCIAQQGSYESLMSQPGPLKDLFTLSSNSNRGGDSTGFTEKEVSVEDAGKSCQKAKLREDEERHTGAVPWQVYWSYARMMGSLAGAAAFVGLLVGAQACKVGTTVLLGLWTANAIPHWLPGHYIGLYGGFGVAQAVFTWAATLGMTFAGIRASYAAYETALEMVTRSTLRWFDTNPTGRIVSRLSKDVEQLDDRLSYQWNLLLTNALSVLGTVGLVIYTFPYLGFIFIPLLITYYLCGVFYNRTSREVKRIGSILRSHIYSQFGQQLQGLSVVRAFGQEEQFLDGVQHAVKEETRAYILTVTLQQWLAVRLDIFGNILVLGIALFGAATRDTTDPAKVGVVLTYTLATTSVLSTLVNLIAIVEQEMNCVERITEYGQLAPEGPEVLPYDPPKVWPYSGHLTCHEVKMSYNQDTPLALNGVTFEARPGEKIGVIGRTGAGKSSLVSALLRLTEVASGTITIDNVDTRSIGLTTLRRRLSVIPQDTFLFSGSIRDNLDPYGGSSDAELHDALQRSGLADPRGMPSRRLDKFKLDAEVEKEGANFSVGERQLLALSRALVRGSRLLLMDEATSAVDGPTDALIQGVIQTGLEQVTLLCIAHRLRTVAYFDRILVMDGGRLIEQAFRGMCIQSNLTREDIMCIQSRAHENRVHASSFMHATLRALAETSAPSDSKPYPKGHRGRTSTTGERPNSTFIELQRSNGVPY